MNPFDDLTLGEVEVMTSECLEGKSFEDVSPFNLAGAVMYMHQRRDNNLLEWSAFKNATRMSEIKAFSELMDDESELNPTNGARN